MAITSYDDYIASKKQLITYRKTAAMTTVAANVFNPIGLAGDPGGTGTYLAGTNTANGVMLTDATAGFPVINEFQASAKGYLSNISFTNSVASTAYIVDVLFRAGPYAFNANTTLTGQPDLSSRIVDADWKTTEIWIEAVTAFTGAQTITITYTNQDGVTGKTTGAIVTGVAPTLGRVFVVPFAAGDSGVRKIESVVSSVSTAGTFNVLIVRQLVKPMRVRFANDVNEMDLLKTGLVEVFDNSAIQAYIKPDSTSSGLFEVFFEIANK